VVVVARLFRGRRAGNGMIRARRSFGRDFSSCFLGLASI
jgi:hypothetical protein